jgi:hypothetical protein
VANQHGRTHDLSSPHLAGYGIYWRLTTVPEWNHSAFLDDVIETTSQNVVIDNRLFVVSKVSNGGFESPVAFPGTAGAFFAEAMEL